MRIFLSQTYNYLFDKIFRLFLLLIFKVISDLSKNSIK